MFVRWKRRQKKDGKVTLYSYLCKSERQGGKVVAGTVGYLGSCPESFTPEQQQEFWIQAEANLDKYAVLGKEHEKIRASIAKKIPRIALDQDSSEPKEDHQSSLGSFNPVELQQLRQTRKYLSSNNSDASTNELGTAKQLIDTLEKTENLVTLVETSPIKASMGVDTEAVDVESSQLNLLKVALDSFFDGILLINTNGHILQSNVSAQKLFANAVPKTVSDKGNPKSSIQPLQPLLDEIWQMVTAMHNSRSAFPDRKIVLDSEVKWDTESFRIRVQWLDLMLQDQPCLLVTIGDLQQAIVNQVNVDRQKYNLTPREAEIWQLHLQGLTRQDIANCLFISIDTVKKHLKNIRMKRRMTLSDEKR